MQRPFCDVRNALRGPQKLASILPEKPVAHPGSLAYIPRSFRRKRRELSHFRVPGPDAICLEGTVIEMLREAKLFRVELKNGHQLLGHVSSRRREEAAGLKPGDKVNLEMSPFDFSKGRIVFRTETK